MEYSEHVVSVDTTEIDDSGSLEDKINNVQHCLTKQPVTIFIERLRIRVSISTAIDSVEDMKKV